MTTALILTVREEADSIEALLASVAEQTLTPDSLSIVDGGSTDATLSIIEAWRDRLPLRLGRRPGAGISAGRNAAIRATDASILLVTDAGVRLDRGWAEALAAPFADPNVHAVAGWFEPDPQTLFEIAMAATVLPARSEIDPARFLPSSRSFALRRSAWEAVGGYPEWLDYCEDLLLDLRLRQRFGPFAWAPQAVAYFRPRGSFGAFFRQYYRYARGDGKARLWTARHLVRYATYVAVLALVLGSLVATPLVLLPIAVGATLYCRRPWLRLARWQLSPVEWVIAAALVPPLRAWGDLAKMLGYPAGLAWWLRHRPASGEPGPGER